MDIPIIVSSVFVLAVLILCLTKPNAGRMFLGLFPPAMAIGSMVHSLSPIRKAMSSMPRAH